jgi:hypothetical protein
LERPKSRAPKSSVIKILISKFFENQILRSPLLRNQRWTRLPGGSREKNRAAIQPDLQGHPESTDQSEYLFSWENPREQAPARNEAGNAVGPGYATVAGMLK